MGEYFVAGGVFQKLQGEKFDLVSPGPGESPYVLPDSIMDYFRKLSANAHLYRVEADYSLTLVALSPEALRRGVKAPDKVRPDAKLTEKLRLIVKHDPPAAIPVKHGK
jgi:hypothetical protein